MCFFDRNDSVMHLYVCVCVCVVDCGAQYSALFGGQEETGLGVLWARPGPVA